MDSSRPVAEENRRKIEQKNALYLSVNVFSMKVLIGDTILTSPAGDETAILVVIRATLWSDHVNRTHDLPGSAVNRSTDWANPAVVERNP